MTVDPVPHWLQIEWVLIVLVAIAIALIFLVTVDCIIVIDNWVSKKWQAWRRKAGGTDR